MGFSPPHSSVVRVAGSGSSDAMLEATDSGKLVQWLIKAT
jgi:hypothetical protein